MCYDTKFCHCNSNRLVIRMGSEKFWGCRGPTPLGWGYGWPLKTCYSPMCFTLSNFVGFGEGRGPKIIWRCCGPIPLGFERIWPPLEICFSTNCVTMPNSVILGQTVRAWLCRSARKLWPLRPALSTSLNVIGTDTDWSATYDFLLVFQVTMRLSHTVFETNGNIFIGMLRRDKN